MYWLRLILQWRLKVKEGWGFSQGKGVEDGGKAILRERGFTIVELLVVLAILGTVGLILVEVFLRLLSGGRRNVAAEQLENEGRFAVEKIIEKVRNAKQLTLVGVDCRDPIGVVCEVDEVVTGDCMVNISSLDREEIFIGCAGVGVDVGGGVTDGRIEEIVEGAYSRLTSDELTVTGCMIKCSKQDYLSPGVFSLEINYLIGQGSTRVGSRVEGSIERSVVLENI